MNYNTREEWLTALVEKLAPLFVAQNYELPAIRVSCSWPSRLPRKRIGECWQARASKDGSSQIFISPTLDDGVRVADVMVHELLHAVLPDDVRHKGPFRQGMKALGLEGKPTATTAGSNYLQDGPKLYSPGPDSKQSFSVRGFACEWADHVLKIDYSQQQVVGGRTETDNRGRVKEHAGKIVGNTTRAIFTMPSDPSFFAKTRTLTEPLICFDSPNDDSLWRFLFPEEYGE